MRQQISCTILLWVVGTLCWSSMATAAEKLVRPRYMTAYACEGSLLNIKCDDGHIISLIRANYGRFSITVCNQNGVSDLNVDCMSTRSFRVLQEKCGHMSSCKVNITSETFGDPCPGTIKYIEAHYTCVLASTTLAPSTTKGLPPWYLTTSPSDWFVPPTSPGIKSSSTTRPTTSSTTTTVPTTIQTTPSTTTTVSDRHMTISYIVKAITSTTTQPPVNKDETPVFIKPDTPTDPPIDFQMDYCSPVWVRDLKWNWTKKGEIAVIQCPGGATGNAKWRCGTNPVRWTPENPDLSGCKSASVLKIIERFDQGKSVVNIANDLADLTRTNPLYGGDTLATTSLLKKMASKMPDTLYPILPNKREEMIEELMQSVIKTSSNLLDPQRRVSWNDLSRREQMKAATSLLVGLEENAYLLADQVNYEKVLVKADKNVMMSVKVYKIRNVKEIHFPTNKDLNNVAWNQATDSVLLPANAVFDRIDNDLIKVIFFTFSNLEELLQPFADDNWLTEYDHSPNVTRIVNTRIISVSVGRGHVPLRQPIVITLRHLREDNVSNPVCAFWNYDTNLWSDDGCKVLSTNRTHTVCSCVHVTNFAVLMDVHGVKISSSHELALQMITYIGCIISIVCLTFSFITFAMFRTLKGDRTTIHKNLCLCLLIAEVIFLVGINQTDKPLVCSIVAGLLHFFFLCSFAWMFLEGFQLYVMLIEVFETEKSRIRWYYCLGYGVPLIIVIVSCIIDPSSYGTENFCWLRADNYFIFSFVGPVAMIILVNFIFLSITIYMMCRHANMSTALKNKEQTKLSNIRAWVRGALVLVFLLGLTWTFGLLYLNEESIIMAYTFTILNSLQGLFIFLFHCVQNDKVQKEYKKLLRRSHCLPTCMKDSEKDRRSSFYINSNGTASVPNSNSSSAIQQSNFKNIWGSQNGKTNVGRNSLKKSTSPQGMQVNNLPDVEMEKSSFKSTNRDSGHGGSDHEDTLLNNQATLRNNRPVIDYGGITGDISIMDNSVIDSNLLPEYCQDKRNAPHELQQLQMQQHQHHQPPPSQMQASLAAPTNKIPYHHHHHHQHSSLLHNRLHRPLRNAHQVRLSPLNHVYMDIDGKEGEPVYEEIEHHHEQQISDLSDEDSKRRSDVSRQSSGSYGDNRPLIPQTHGFSDFSRHHGAHEQESDPIHRHTGQQHQYYPRNITRGRPPPPPDQQSTLPSPSLTELTNHSEHIDPNCKSMPDIKLHGNISTNIPPQHHPSIYYCAEANNKQPKSLPDLHGSNSTAITNEVPQDVHYPSDNTLVAMLDGRKVVCRLQPTKRKESHNYRTNSFSEC